MNTCTLLKDILRLVPYSTEILLDNEKNITLYHNVNDYEDLYKYNNCIVLSLDVWDETTLYVRIINE